MGGPLSPTTYSSVALTGHRPQSLDRAQRRWVRDSLHDVANGFASRYGTTEAISGMALGADTWWAQAALAAGLDLAAYLPSPDQASRWRQEDRRVWEQLRSRAAREVVLGPAYRVQLLFARNEAMLRDADALVAVWLTDQRSGGTFDTTGKALRRGLPVLHIDPASRRIGWLQDSTAHGH